MREFKYDAFISYKHAEFDTQICKMLHRQLETYRVVKDGKTRKIRRVFLDTEELSSSGNLSESIQEALDQSRYLIVVCSRQTPASPWVGKEIEYFINKHGYQNVLALLIDGEPEEAFPEQLRKVNIDGVLEEIEPLAADIRAAHPDLSKKMLRNEVLRLLAPLLGMTYDELRQRHQKYVIRRIIRTAVLIGAFLASFLAYAVQQWYITDGLYKQVTERNDIISGLNADLSQKNQTISEQNISLEERTNRVLTLQSRYMAKESEELLQKGDRRRALFVARHAMPMSMENPDRPYTHEAEYALTEALGVYDFSNTLFGKDAVLEYDAAIRNFELSPNGELIAVVTNSSVSVREVRTDKELFSIAREFGSYEKLHFSDDGAYLYTNAAGNSLVCYNALTGAVVWASDCTNFAVSGDGGVLAAQGMEVIYPDEHENMEAFPLYEKYLWNYLLYFSDKEAYMQPHLYILDFETGEKLKAVPSVMSSELVLSENGEYAAATVYDFETYGLYFINLINGSAAHIAEDNLLGGYNLKCLGDNLLMFGLDYDNLDFLNPMHHLRVYSFANGTQTGGWSGTGYKSAELIDSGHALMISDNGYALYDYMLDEFTYTVAMPGINSYLLRNSVLFIASDESKIRVVITDAGYQDAVSEFDSAAGVREMRLQNGVLAARKGNEVYIMCSFKAPGFTQLTDGNVTRAWFLDNDMALACAVDYWQMDFTLLSGGEDVSHISAGSLAEYVFNEETKLLYILENDELAVYAVSDVFELINTVSAQGTHDIKIMDGAVVIYGNGAAYETDDNGNITHTIYDGGEYILNIYKKSDAYALAFVGELLVLNAASAARPLGYIYAVNPMLDEYAYYQDRELIISGIYEPFENSVTVPGVVSSLFYSPDGAYFFAGTEAEQLFAVNCSTLEVTQMTAEFKYLPDEAFYIGERLALRDFSGYATLWDKDELKITARISGRVAGYDDTRIILSNILTAGTVPVYTAQMLIDTADEILSGLNISDEDKERYFIE